MTARCANFTMKISHLLVAFAFILVSPLDGDVVTVDFDDQNGCVPEFERSGIRITNGRGTMCFRISGNNSVSNGTYFTNDVENLRIVHIEGDVFTPVRADLAEYSISVGAPDPVRFIGTKASGDTVVFEVILDQIADGPGGVEDFETIYFPAEFSDIISLESPTRLWSLDNLIVETISPPPLPENQGLEASFANADFLRGQTGLTQNNLVIGSGFHYKNGNHPPQTVIFLSPGGFSFSASTPYYDSSTGFVIYKSGNDIYRRGRSGFDLMETLAAIQAEGYQVSSIGNPISHGGRLVFEGYDLKGNDSYHIFQRASGILTKLVGPTTLLPDGSGGFSNPHYFPRYRAIGDDVYAFQTSLQGSFSTARVFVKRGRNEFALVLSEGDPTVFGNITAVEGLAFDSNNNLIVDARVSNASIRLRYDSNGLTGSVSRSVTTNPVNAGLTASGVTQSTLLGKRFLLAAGVLYQESNGNFYKVLGIGDSLGGEMISDLRYLGAPEGLPERVIVDVAFYGNSSQRNHYLITLNQPVDAPPRLGKPFLYAKNGRLYIPLSHLTVGRNYHLEVSTDMEEWATHQTINDISPIQFVIVEPPLSTPRAFFRMVESRPTSQNLR